MSQDAAKITTAAMAEQGGAPTLPSRLVSISKHTFSIILTFIGLTAITFVIGRVMPADPVLAIVGDRASQDVYDAVRLQLGLDKPIYEQYLIYLLMRIIQKID